jgi:hypothetical protein
MLYDQWKNLKTDSKSGLSSWIKGVFTGRKKVQAIYSSTYSRLYILFLAHHLYMWVR